MNRSDIEKAVSTALGGDAAARANAKVAVDAMVESVSAALVAGDRVYVRDLGVFRPQIVASRMVRSPATGERIRAKKTARVRFMVASSLKSHLVSGKIPKVKAKTKKK